MNRPASAPLTTSFYVRPKEWGGPSEDKHHLKMYDARLVNAPMTT